MGLTVGQEKCVKTLDRPLVVAAGAGSGKTFTLTKRIVGALETGFVSDIGEVCAITFTKKAAGELKSRLKGELRACGLTDQALKVDDAWVSTIHGMCARILRAHAIPLGIDPSFGVIEDGQSKDYLGRAVDTVLTQRQLGERSAELDELFSMFKPRSFGREASVEKMLMTLVEAASIQAGGTSAFEMPGVTCTPAAAVEQALDIMEGLLEDAATRKQNASRDKWMAATEERIAAARQALEQGLDDYADAYALVASFTLAKNFGGGPRKEVVADVSGPYSACVMELRLGAARGCLQTLTDLAQEALNEYTRLKRAAGVLDNNDLLVMAASAIEEQPSIAARYTDKFKLIMVDEFQDTDQMQVDMIRRLAGEGACRLCTVGDAQQSIYRFRGADVSVYRRHLEFVRQTAGDECIIELSDNFRSHADVLSFVDRVFEKPDMFGGEFMSLGAGRDEAGLKAPFKHDGPRIVIQQTTTGPEGGSADDARAVAAKRIARSFAELVASGHSANEMVILLGGMTHADVYAQALRDEGLSCVITGGSVFSSTPEAGLARAFVCVLANPNDTAALLNVLTSPMFALTASDLLQAGGLAGFWRAADKRGEEGGLDNCSPQLACALRVMADAKEAVGRAPVARIMEDVAVESGWLTRQQDEGAEGIASAANMMKAIRMVDSIERAGASGASSVMRQFVDTLDNAKNTPGALSVSGGNSVRIMTIHASKGLEFPIVATAEMGDVKLATTGLAVAALGGKVYVSLNAVSSSGPSKDGADAAAAAAYVLGEDLAEDELARAVAEDAGALHRHLALCHYDYAGEVEEAKRLLYVALTRAKESVIVSTVGERTKGDSNPLGLPKSAFRGAMTGIDPSLEAFAADSRTLVDFGGTRPALVECVSVAVFTAEEEGGPAEASQERGMFRIPAALPSRKLMPTKFKALHRGIFSYSSISDASHEGDVLQDLARTYAVQVDSAADGGLDASGASSAGHDDEPVAFGEPGSKAAAGSPGGLAAGSMFGPLPDDDEWGLDASQVFDEDRATDLGTAFHRLAQYAVVARGAAGPLSMPPADRVEALSRTCNLDGLQRRRLASALDRWFGCDEARAMEALPSLAAEVPFFVAVGGDGAESAYLEGEIDLLGFDENREHAFVVDYKTGGRDDETADELRCKHVLQAACYAYAIMLQGVQVVDASFVRVERPRADDEPQPQCVRYRFDRSDLPRLEEVIEKVYRMSCS